LFYQLSILAIFLYGCFLIFLFVYSVVQLNLAIKYAKFKRHSPKKPVLKDDQWPVVTVQLPVYNELYVIERLIDAICEFEYPAGKLEIQVLDDSTDESFEVAAKKIAEKQKQGIDIKHVKRPKREGYKAGALGYGLDICRGEFVAIFDADFIPRKDFLLQTIPHFFHNDRIGVVQTKWEHLNEEYSLLTRLQAFGLDAHFTVEQVGRNKGDHFINFNGTAGVWRKSTIYDAGGWESDTITEDLDLSYRAQLRGWEFVYLPMIGSPSELPAEMNALKAQQFRWTKGAAECTVKNLPKVLNAKHLTFGQKVHGAFHLMNSVVFLCILGTSVLSVPMLIIKNTYGDLELLFKIATVFMISFFFLGFFYWISRPEQNFFKKFFNFLWEYPTFLSVSMGLSLHNAVAVLEGFTGKKSSFVRTPKFAISGKTSGTWKDKKYRAIKVSPLTIFEFLMCVYFAFGIYYAFAFTGRKEKPLAQVGSTIGSSEGNEFYFTYYSGDDQTAKSYHALRIETKEATSASVSCKMTGWKKTITVNPGEPTILNIPIDSVATLNDNFYFVGAIHLTSQEPVNLSLINDTAHPEVYSVIPPTSQMTATYSVPDAPSKQEAVTEISLLALEDSTVVTVNATHELFNGTKANAPYTVLLNKGDIHNILAKDGGNLAGTSIKSIQENNDAKSFACYAGSAPKPYDLGLLPFHIMLTLGYAFVTFYSLKHARS
jgi:cellulose synthase/poly-beta-1,6-N-acetylglucosamine synthase-like glycosyltransferase